MNLTAFLFLAFCLNVGANVVSSQTISLSGKNIPLESIFSAVEKQTGFVVFYDYQQIIGAKPVTIDVIDEPLSSFLSSCFRNQPFDFAIEDKTIMVTKISPSSLPDIIISSPVPIRIRVVDADGNPLSGASVVNKNTGNSGVTDAGGVLSLNVNVNDVLLISFIGYESYEQKITSSIVGSSDQRSSGTDSFHTVVLKISDSKLNEVEVRSTGYWTETKERSTGNIAKVEAKDIANQPVTSPLMALQGRMAGVDITPINGTPGGAPQIQIRGQNSMRSDGALPLYVIDGVPVESKAIKSASNTLMVSGFDPLASIDPNSIASIEILKDGDATAIYGSRGANGVVRITTKRANESSKTDFDINFYQGIGELSNSVKLLNTQQYLSMRNEAFLNDGVTPGPIDYDLNGTWDVTKNTDWQKILLGGKANITEIYSGISGGSKNTSFQLGGGVHKEKMIFPGDFGYQRISGNFSLNHSSSNGRFETSLSIAYGANKSKLFNELNYVQFALSLPPNAPNLYDDRGDLNWQLVPSGETSRNSWINPLSFLMNTHEALLTNLVISSALNYEIIPGLEIKTNLGLTNLNGNEILKRPIAANSPTSINSSSSGSNTFGNNTRESWIIEPQINYDKRISSHQFNVIIGTTWQQSNSIYNSTQGFGYTADILLNSIQSASSTIYINDEARYRYVAFFSRVGYDWNGKYLVNLTGRRDGSSRFGPTKRFGNFGAIGGAWIFSNEGFVKDNLSFISFGKLRGSYGITGNDQIGDHKYLDTYGITSGKYQGTIGLNPDALYNPNYAWEVTAKLEAGIEMKFIQDRLSIEVSRYQNRSSNQLVDYALPATTGFTSFLNNFNATIENVGWEFGIQTQNISSSNLRWETSANLTLPKNTLVEFPGIENTSYASLYKVGEPLTIQRLYTWIGVDPQTGVHQILDLDENGILNDKDRVFMKPLVRRYFGGFSNTLSYKYLDLSFLFQFSKFSSNGFLPPLIPGFRANNQPVQFLDRWTTEGDITEMGKFSQSSNSNSLFSNYVRQSDLNTRDVSFLRLKTLSLSYRLPMQLLERIKLKQMRIYFQAQNLFTLTKYDIVLDPETGNKLPPLRMVTVGIQIKF